MKSVKLLSMTFLLLGFGKVEFCEMFAKRGTLQRRGREVLRDGMFKKIKTLFSLIIMLLIEIYFSRFIVLNMFPTVRRAYLAPGSTPLVLRQL